MDAGDLLRTARRLAGVSQRELARRAGVSRSTVEGVEAGRRDLSVAVLQSLLEVAGLELTAERAVPTPCAHVRAHLRRSLSARLHLLLGGDGRVRGRPAPPAWTELDHLAAGGPVFLTGPAAVGLWVPGIDSRTPVPVGLAGLGAAEPPDSTVLRVSALAVPPDCTVTVPLPVRSIRAPDPTSLALHPDCAPWRSALRVAAQVLSDRAARDRAGRRSPAHREPQREQEAWRLLFARRWTMSLRPPDRLDGRGWRLADEVGLQEWIERRAERG